MSFFRSYFGVVGERTEEPVCCPFPHRTGTGQLYYESNPSAHVNLDKGMFHCKVCAQGYTEQAFIKTVLGCSHGNALRLYQIYNDIHNEEDYEEWQKSTRLLPETGRLALGLGISDATLTELQVKTVTNGAIGFPVFLYDKLIDVRSYQPGGHPKLRSRQGAVSGLILPFDIWRATPKQRTTLICAGEKDMAVARSHGFNAITITGGESCLPALTREFDGRRIVICYDNDSAGVNGAERLAEFLHPFAESVKVCTAFHEVCCEEKEDITDFFVKYRKTKQDLIGYIEATPLFIPDPQRFQKHYPIMDLHTASAPENLNKLVRSNIQVVATSDATFVTPTSLLAEKYKAPTEGDVLAKGTIKEWALDPQNIEDVLHLIDNNFKEPELEKNYRKMLRVLQKERCISIKQPTKATVYKCTVTDMYETTTDDVIPMEYVTYSIGSKLESGKKYLVTYKLVPHPYRGQQLLMLVTHATQAMDSVSNFKLTPEIKAHLRQFQCDGTVEEKMYTFVQKFKGLLGYNGNDLLINAIDLSYHTVLSFDFGRFRNIKGCLDTIIVGETRMGKSSTAEAARVAYGLGAFASLAGNAATIPGLIGGSNKTTSGTFQTRAGLIPQNHKGLIVFEELGKTNSNIIKELTDIRSSNEVRIARVSGTLTMPAFVRMITLSNVKAGSDGGIKSIASYPNGIVILAELIGTGEDIARYDIALVLGDRGPTEIDPYWEPEQPFEQEALRSRIRWVWSRTSDQIIIDDDVGKHIMQCANVLNDKYGCHIKIFGTEAWKKITRLALAVAGYLVSTDAEFEKLILLKEHVDYAVQYFMTIYDNGVFKLKEYADHERRFSQIDEAGVSLLQDVYTKAPALLLHLEQNSSTTRNNLQAVTGLDASIFNVQLNRLVMGLFLVFTKYDIVPTERFRLGMARINRNARVLRVGEHE